MALGIKTKIAAFSLLLPLTFVAVAAQPAQAGSFDFDYHINATTHLKKLNQTVKVPQGSFTGSINFDTSRLTGAITLPPATIKLSLAGIALPVTATVQIVETRPVIGTVDITQNPFPIVASASFNIKITSAKVAGLPINLVGNSCQTSTPVIVVMRGTASIGSPSTFTAPYTIPLLKTCGAATIALNKVIPGPGNTFTAVATPA